MKPALRLAAIGVAVVWFFVVAVNYYIVHKPFTLANALAILNALGDVFVAGALVALAAALGRRVLRAFSFASPLEALVFQTGIGLGIVSFTVFALGLAGLLQRWLFWLALALAFVLLRADVRAVWRDLRAIHLPAETRFERALAWFVAASLGLAFLVALTPTRAWDAQLYHLLAGKIALAQGRIAPPPDIPSLNYPSLMEMLYLAAMVLKDDGAAAVIHLGYALFCVGALLAFGQRFLSTWVGWVASAFLIAVPSFLLVASWPYNDAALAFYASASWYALVVAKERADSRGAILAGACAGMALGMKYTAIFVPLALLAVLVFDRERLPVATWVAMLVACALTASPWYIRNWVFNGNPVYPFFWGGRYWDALRNTLYTGLGTGLASDPIRLLLVPWEATIFGQEGKTVFEATSGALLLMFLPLLPFLWRMRGSKTEATVLRAGSVFSITLYVFWLLGVAASRGLMQTRLLFAAFPVLTLLAAIVSERLAEWDVPRFSLTAFARLVVLVILAVTWVGQVFDWTALNPLAYLTGIESREEYLAKRLTPAGYWETMQFLGELDSPQVFFLWEPRAYYVPSGVTAQPDEILDLFAAWSHRYRSAEGIARALKEQGYRYILLCRWGLDFQLENGVVKTEEARLLQELLDRHTRQVYGAQPLELIEIAGKWRVQDAERAPYAVYALEP